MDNSFEKSIFDRLLHMGFCEFNKNLRTHVTFNVLIKLSNLAIRNPPQVSFFIILLRLILSGPEFHKNL